MLFYLCSVSLSLFELHFFYLPPSHDRLFLLSSFWLRQFIHCYIYSLDFEVRCDRAGKSNGLVIRLIQIYILCTQFTWVLKPIPYSLVLRIIKNAISVSQLSAVWLPHKSVSHLNTGGIHMNEKQQMQNSMEYSIKCTTNIQKITHFMKSRIKYTFSITSIVRSSGNQLRRNGNINKTPNCQTLTLHTTLMLSSTILFFFLFHDNGNFCRCYCTVVICFDTESFIFGQFRKQFYYQLKMRNTIIY